MTTPQQASGLAAQSPRPAGVSKVGMAFGLAALVIALDQASKYWILSVLDLPSLGSAPLFWPLSLTMVYNPGVSFGLLPAGETWVRWALVVFSLGVAAVLARAVFQTKRIISAAAFGLVMGGAVGNAIDRIRFGVVADFLDARAIHFPWVFNIADSAITIGVALLLLDSFRPELTQPH